jgi:hypothetical protein
MNNSELIKAWPVLKRQVKGLSVPALENIVRLSGRKRDPFRVLISYLAC